METHYFFSVYPRIDSPLLLTYSFISANSFVKFTYSSITPPFSGSLISLSVIFITVSFLIFYSFYSRRIYLLPIFLRKSCHAQKNNSKYHNTSNHKHHHLIYTYYRPLELRVTIQCITNRSNHFFWQLIVLHLFEDSTEHMIFQQRSSVGTWQIRQYFLQAAAEI